MPYYVLVATTRQKKTINFENYKIQFIKLKKGKLFGYKRERVDNKYLFVAELEKLILDCLYLPKNCPISDVFEALKECKSQIEVVRIVNYAIKMNSNIVLKRLGFLFELLGIDIYEQIRTYINRKYENLSPNHLRKGGKNKKWKLIENIILYAKLSLAKKDSFFLFNPSLLLK